MSSRMRGVQWEEEAEYSEDAAEYSEVFYRVAWREMNDVNEKNWQSCVARDE